MITSTPPTRSRFRLLPALIVASIALMVLQELQTGPGAQSSIAALRDAQAAIERGLPTSAKPAPDVETGRVPFGAVGDTSRERAERQFDACPTFEGNPISPLVAFEDNPRARAFEGFSMRDRRGRHTRPWRSFRRADRARRGAVVQRPLLVFLETPREQEDFTKPWFGPVRFDRPGFPTTKQKIVEQVFGKDFDHRDPASLAGFYYRESGGELVIRGDRHSVHTVVVPHMTFNPRPMVEAILDQLDPIVDFRKHADEFGWADPVIVMTPYSLAIDVFEASLMSNPWSLPIYGGYGPNVEDIGPALTDDVLADGTSVGLASMAISMLAINFGANEVPTSRWFGTDPEILREDNLYLYAHEYGHAIGLSHMMTADYNTELESFGSNSFLDRPAHYSFSRQHGSGFVSTIMNYASGSGFRQHLPRDGRHYAGLDAVNRSKLGWGNIVDLTLAGPGRWRPGHLAPGDKHRVEIVEHLARGPFDRRPQIVRINLPAQEVPLFPRIDASGNPTTVWRPNADGSRMVWSGRTFGGSRTMETELRIPSDVPEPVLSFWTKYGGPSWYIHAQGFEFGWVQISTDRGRTWTSLAGQSSSAYVQPGRAELQWFGEDLGAPAFTGNSHAYSPDGWIFEQVPLPVSPGASIRLRFNFSGYRLGNEQGGGSGWLLDDIYLGTAGNRTQHLVSDFESDDTRRWSGLLPESDQGIGFAVVEETVAFPHAYIFELRGNNAHDEIAFKEMFPKVLSHANADLAEYAYEEGVVGYYTNHYASFWAYPYFHSGSATRRRVPVDRLRRSDVTYPFLTQAAKAVTYSFGFLFSLAQDPRSGFTFDDLMVLTAGPEEAINMALFYGETQFTTFHFPHPSAVTLLDASPTYRPADVTPSAPHTPFPERRSGLWPFVFGAPGGWPKSIGHGPLGSNDPTTTTVLGQPFVWRDAAFHPDRNARFDDRIDYRQSFVSEFAAWHRQSATAALGSMTPAERIFNRPTTAVPVGGGQVIQRHRVEYCHQNAAGACVPATQATQRSFVAQMMYERLATMVFGLAAGGCVQPVEETLATKPAWDTFYACQGAAVETSHLVAIDLLEIARNVGNNPAYAFLKSFGDEGMLSPGLWAEVYADLWSRPKAPAPLPGVGVIVDVERITRGDTPVATLTIRRAGDTMTRR